MTFTHASSIALEIAMSVQTEISQLVLNELVILCTDIQMMKPTEFSLSLFL